MRPAIRRVIATLAVLVAASSWAAAEGVLEKAQPGGAQPVATGAPGDPLGRQTPAGAVMGFLAASARADWPRAARYLDTRLPDARARELARELKVLLDRGLSVDLGRLSRKPEGSQDERFGKDRELVGTIETESGTLDVLLVRVPLGEGTAVWMFAPETLRAVPAAHEEFEPSFIEQYLPPSITKGYGLGYRWWSWLVLLGVSGVAYLIALLLTRMLMFVARLVARRAHSGERLARLAALSHPMRWLVFGLLLGAASASFLTVRQRYLGVRVSTLLVIGSLTWVGVKVLSTAVAKWAGRLEQQGTTERVALVRLTGRLLQIAAVVTGILVVLTSVGINLTPVLAGLGVGGIAVALASQKTLENLFGGMIVIGDSPIRIGAFCRVGTLTGTVEDIGLRSTRIRTLARTVVSIPNADLASQSIENFSCREKVLFNPVLTLRYETTAEQLRAVTARMLGLLGGHGKVESSSARVRLLRLGPSGFEVEVFAYVMETEYEAFLAIQEDLLLGLIDAIEAGGTALALPSQAMYVTRDHGIAGAKTSGPSPGRQAPA